MLDMGNSAKTGRCTHSKKICVDCNTPQTQKGSATVGSMELTIPRLGNLTDTNLRVERGLERIGGSAATVGSLELKTVPRQGND